MSRKYLFLSALACLLALITVVATSQKTEVKNPESLSELMKTKIGWEISIKQPSGYSTKRGPLQEVHGDYFVCGDNIILTNNIMELKFDEEDKEIKLFYEVWNQD